jgi:single-strand DNA-binding protein
MAINTVSISGNLTRDGELPTPNILSFTVAVNNRIKDRQTGEWGDNPCYMDCKVLGRRAEGLCQYIRKGEKVCVSGRLDQERWQAKDGSNRSRIVVLVDELELMGGSGRKAVVTPRTNANIERGVREFDEPYADADIPF